ncbi:MAG: diphosphate--fructose-6-phosphate 1-phosphotransferase [Chloroflexi bacterium]|nr:diphosphate--fructose-6-phosphate 1-phosphotransferase [Chloroflexota bacterium]MDA1219271.1 diphosphate--fructose-6-phosphate 1-phosphotransferase [Chloroflexota bacterium]
MNNNRKGNALVMQSGGCTPVINRSLAGVVWQAMDQPEIGQIIGASHGLEGILNDDLVDLSEFSKAAWNRIAKTPAAALGSTRHKLQSDEAEAVLSSLDRHGVRFMFTIGGNDSAETGLAISRAARHAGYDLQVMNVPKTIDNDLVLTDHSPGYGSAARFVALATIGAGQDAQSMGQASPITIIEVMGRDTGWLAASAALAKQRESDAPHLICVPEVPVEEDRFLNHIEDAYRKYGFAVAVIAENTRGANGVLGGQSEPWFVDDFGHEYFDGPARYLAGLVSQRLKVRARYEKPGTIQRSFIPSVSQTDASEAERAGRAAVRHAVDGHTDEIVTLIREPGRKYICNTGLAPLDQVAGLVKTMPQEYLDPANDFVTPAFIEYALPLLGSRLPRFGRVFP